MPRLNRLRNPESRDYSPSGSPIRARCHAFGRIEACSCRSTPCLPMPVCGSSPPSGRCLTPNSRPCCRLSMTSSGSGPRTARRWPRRATCRYGQFLFVAVDESNAGASGCSIDAMTRVLSALEGEMGLELVNHGPVLYRAGDHIGASGSCRIRRPRAPWSGDGRHNRVQQHAVARRRPAGREMGSAGA